MGQPLFSQLDYFLMFAYIIIVVGIGVWVGKGQKSTKDYFLAGRSMGWFPIGISTVASLYSAISYMGTPSEYRSYDLRMMLGIVSMIPTAVIVMYVFMPFYHRLQVFSAYEYLEERFNLTVRSLASAIFVFWRILWMGTAVYVPSLVLHTITDLPLVPMIVLVGVVATLYTVVGGMKAVIWTDVAQFFVLSGGSLLALWVVSSHVGSISEIWTVAEQGGKTKLFDWSLDPTIRVTTWGAVLGALVANLGMFGADQVSVQRYLAAKSLNGMQRSFIINTLGGWVMALLMILIGLGLYAFYAINPENLPAHISGDKVFPYFISTEMPLGLRGMMIAAILAAAMSSIDSGLNSSATTLITDFFKRFRWLITSKDSSVQEVSRELRISRGLTLVLGMIVTVLACFVGALGTIIEITNKLVNSFAGPMLGIFVLGMLMRKTEWRGAFVGLLVGTVVTAYCIIDNSLSFLWFGPIGLIVTVLVGKAISFLLGNQLTSRPDLVFQRSRSQSDSPATQNHA